MNFRSLEQLGDCIYKNLDKVPKDVDLIVGIPRSGMLAANLLALYLNLPLTDVGGLFGDKLYQSGSTRKCRDWIHNAGEAGHILILDDSISSGKAMRGVKEAVREHHVTARVTYAAVYALAVSCHMVDLYFEICEQPRMFEWNYMHHWALEYTCMDIDGVLCADPSFFQNDDGARYREFLLHAAPRIIPTQKVGKLVTGRLERYREETQAWLEKYGVEYGELIMLPAATGAERRKEYDVAQFKAQVYQESGCILFIESEYEQAVQICSYAQKPVLSVENRKLIRPDKVGAHLKMLKDDWRVTLKRGIRKLRKKIDYVK